MNMDRYSQLSCWTPGGWDNWLARCTFPSLEALHNKKGNEAQEAQKGLKKHKTDSFFVHFVAGYVLFVYCFPFVVQSPSLDKEGWTRPREKVAKPPCRERTGWLVQVSDNRRLNQPPRLREAKVASRNRLDRAATPPCPRRGVLSQFNASQTAPAEFHIFLTKVSRLDNNCRFRFR
jgi:hypothetical protein